MIQLPSRNIFIFGPFFLLKDMELQQCLSRGSYHCWHAHYVCCVKLPLLVIYGPIFCAIMEFLWLGFWFAIWFATLTYKALHPGRPPYLADLLQYHKTTKSTHLSSTQLLSVPRHNLSFGSRAFRVSAPKVWNSLPFQIRQSESRPTFKCHLKTHCFQSAYLTT